MLKADLIEYLRELNTPAGDRVHWEVLPQGTPLPAIAVSKLSGSDPRTLDGARLASRGLFRIDLLAADYETANKMANSIAPLDGYRGQIGDTNIHMIRKETDPDASVVDGDAVYRGITHDYSIVYLEN